MKRDSKKMRMMGREDVYRKRIKERR